MGYSVRTFGWRYTAWVTFNTTSFTAAWNATNHTPPDHGGGDGGELGPAAWCAFRAWGLSSFPLSWYPNQ
jgi:hypothetical protein